VERTRNTIPEYNNHGDVLDEDWPRLTEELPEFQFHSWATTTRVERTCSAPS
jgi:hypothetical protein